MEENGMSDRIKLAEKEEERRIWHSPDIVALCIDSYTGERQEGRIYHQYADTPLCFASLMAAFLQMDAFYDAICFPFASVRPRSFFIDRKAAGAARKSRKMPKLPEYKRKDVVVMEAFEDVIKHRGEDATFIVRVQHRQHASWQGEVTWIDGQKKESFRSALELVRLIDGALNGEDKAFGQ